MRDELNSPDSKTRSTPGPDQERLARILDDYLVAIEQGAPLTPDDLLARYPEDAERLRGYLSGLQLFHAAAADVPQQAGNSGSFAGLPQPLQTIGDYQLVREVGRGGMGVVYEAFQVSLRRRVALKILPFSVASDAKQLGRFKNEAQAAAQVLHPNIVPVYAVGEEGGIHYYVMQLIEGQSLTSLLEGLRSHGRQSDGTTAPNHPDYTVLWQQQRGLPHDAEANVSSHDGAVPTMKAAETADHIRVVARLGLQAADALHAAHEYGVVHRDVKPSNLLLDDNGKLWITDFGLARCREHQGLTQTGDVLGTMRYMSPEQSQGRTGLIDQRTDIYSLGITLYELATLHHPADGLSDLQLYFDRKHFSPKQLRQWNRHIPVDFQTIVLKCVSEFPHERYSTAQELADELQRFLEGRPIMATPPNLLTRVSKWAKRRRGVVYATAAALFLAALGAFTTMGMLGHERSVTREQVFEQKQQFASEALETFNPTKYADQLAAIPGAEGVRYEMLRAGVEFFERYEREIASNPALADDWALAQSKLGMLNEKLDDKQAAVNAHAKALKVWQGLVVRDPTNLDNVRHLALAQNNLGMSWLHEGRAADAVALLSKARDSQVFLLKAEPNSHELTADLARSYSNVGLALMQTGDKNGAISDFDNAIRVGRQLAEKADPSEEVLRTLADSYNNLGLLHDVRKPIQAAEAYRNAIEIEQKLVKLDRVNRTYQADLARTYSNLGFLSSRTKEWKKAELCYGDAIQIQTNLVKSSPQAATYRRDLAISYNNLGMAQTRSEHLAEAKVSFQKSVALQESLLAAQPADVETRSNLGSAWNNLGMLLAQQNQLDEAEKAYQPAVEHQRKVVEAVPSNERHHALLSQYYVNSVTNFERQSKFDAAMQAAVARRQLWLGKAGWLYSSAQQLAGIYGKMQTASNVAQPVRMACLQEAIATLREALVAGLPEDKLYDKSLASLTRTEEFQKLVSESPRSIRPVTTQHAAE